MQGMLCKSIRQGQTTSNTKSKAANTDHFLLLSLLMVLDNETLSFALWLSVLQNSQVISKHPFAKLPVNWWEHKPQLVSPICDFFSLSSSCFHFPLAQLSNSPSPCNHYVCKATQNTLVSISQTQGKHSLCLLNKGTIHRHSEMKDLGQRTVFQEYICHLPGEMNWFVLEAIPLFAKDRFQNLLCLSALSCVSYP